MLIPDHPFYTGLIDVGEAPAGPASLPFELQVHTKYALPRLVLTDAIREALANAYAAGSMASTPLGESPLADVRLHEFMERLILLLGGTVAGKSLLEIGCGNGELLNQLRRRGAMVTGLEIGPQAQVVEDRHGIRVIREPLTPGSLDERFDGILSYGCLEHIDHLDEFFAASRLCLRDDGLFFHSVPNSALSFERVHLDHLLHEHINYFTPVNAVAMLSAQGFDRAAASPTRAGNELMLWGFKKAGAAPAWPVERYDRECAALEEYATKLEQKMAATLAALSARIAHSSIALYAGGFEYGFHLPVGAVRYADGDIYKHGKRWLRGLPAIESPAALAAEPVDCVVVCKPHYFDSIRDALEQSGVNPRTLVSIDALCS